MKHLTKILILLAIWTSSSFAKENDSLIVVTGEDTQDYWVIKKIKRPYYPRNAALNGVEGCAAIGFIIESNGTTSSHRPLAAYPSEVFLQPALDAIRKWRFKPSESNILKQPIFTSQVVEFNVGPMTHEKEVERQIIGKSCEKAANKALKFAPSGPDA